MNDPSSRDAVDPQLDAALQAIVRPGEPEPDLWPRVLAAIDSPDQGRARARTWGLLGARSEAGWGAWARPAAVVAVLALALAAALWIALRHEAAPLVVQHDRSGASQQPRELAHAAPEPAQRTLETRGTERASSSSDAKERLARQASAHHRINRPPLVSDSWEGALPPLDPPEPIAIEQMDEPPVRVARLHIERLQIDPLEVETLEQPGKE